MAQTDLHGINPSKEEIESIIRDAFGKPTLVLSFEKMAKGMMNWVGHVRINKKPYDIILKLSNQPGKWGIAKEVYVMELLRKKAKVPVPKVYAHDFSKKKYPYEYTIVSKIKGKCLEDIWGQLARKEQEQIAVDMGKTLAKINSIEFKQFGRIVGKGCIEHYDSYSEELLEDLNDIYKQHIEAGYMPKETANAVKQFILSKRSMLQKLNKPCLVHNDFHFWHIFVRKIKGRWNITGVIDFGFAEIMPKEGDFVKPDRFIFVKGKNIQRKFIQGYRQILPFTAKNEEIVKILRVYYDFWFIYRLFKANNPELATQYVRIIEKAIGQGNK